MTEKGKKKEEELKLYVFPDRQSCDSLPLTFIWVLSTFRRQAIFGGGKLKNKNTFSFFFLVCFLFLLGQGLRNVLN